MYETTAGLPTEGITYTRLIEHLRLAQEDCAMLSHLTGLSGDTATSRGWLIISEQLKSMLRTTTMIATRKLS